MKIAILFSIIYQVLSLNSNEICLSVEYFLEKNVKFVCYFSCENQYQNNVLAKQLMRNNIRIATSELEAREDLAKVLEQWTVDVGVLLDGSCGGANSILFQASQSKLLNAEHVWLVFTRNVTIGHTDVFQLLNLSVDADVVVVGGDGIDYTLTDVFNFGRIQGNGLEIALLGAWSPNDGLSLRLKGFKYYRRWDFQNLTLRAVSVMDRPGEFDPELLSSAGYTPGVVAMTKIASQLLNLLKESHHFRFNYTIVGRWIGSPERNATLAVTNSLLWEEQDVSSTCTRAFPEWLNWVDICFPPTTDLQTRFYYLIDDKGVGDYENRFLTPMSGGVWGCTLAAGALCAAVLGAAAFLEAKPGPGLYALFSVHAALCQQAFDDGAQDNEKKIQSQGRRLTLLVVGLTSMLLYNYYTSSVVSWLLNAASPSIDTLDKLINSDLELIFEDIGYTKGWLEGHKNGFAFYYSGVVNVKEDELRDKKVTRAKRTVNILQSVDDGVHLIRSGGYAYHTEPYTASQEISRTFSEHELCKLGSLQMMKPASVYILVQKRSPYRQFFVWSLMRLVERGHARAARLRFAGGAPACAGRLPRALALGQAAPAFLLLLLLALLSLALLLLERAWAALQTARRGGGAAEQKTPFVQ